MSPTLAATLLVPADQRGLALLDKLPRPDFAQELTSRRYEKFARVALIGSGAVVNETTLPTLWKICREIGDKLEIAELPEIFIKNETAVRANLLGEEKPLLVISAGALRELPETYLRCLIAHSLTHIVCGHLPYLTLRDLVAAAADNLGVLKVPAALPRALLEEWFFAAQISGDRGMLWAIGNIDTALDFLAALALSENPYGKITVENLLAAGKRYEREKKELPFCPVFSAWSNLQFAAPRYALRAVELEKWANSAEYAAARQTPNDKNSAVNAPNNGESPAYWGAFTGDWNEWEKMIEQPHFYRDKNMDSSADHSASGKFAETEIAKIAATAGDFTAAGITMFSHAATAFFNALKK